MDNDLRLDCRKSTPSLATGITLASPSWDFTVDPPLPKGVMLGISRDSNKLFLRGVPDEPQHMTLYTIRSTDDVANDDVVEHGSFTLEVLPSGNLSTIYYWVGFAIAIAVVLYTIKRITMNPTNPSHSLRRIKF